MIASGLNSYILVWIIFFIRNKGNSISSSNSGSVSFEEISSAQINDPLISEILPIFIKLG